MNKTQFDTVFISDVHLGTDRCNIEKFLKFLNELNTKKLVLVGDILDVHCMEKYNTHWRKGHTKAVEKIVDICRKGTEVIYVLGNHDAIARKYVKNKSFKLDNLVVCDQYIHISKQGEKFLCVHGDQYSQYSSGSWKQYFMNWGYETITPLNNFLKKTIGFSLVNFLKNIQRGKDYINNYQYDLIRYVRKLGGYDGVIAGHIHHANIRKYDNLAYMCCGDWTDTCSAIVEENGSFRIIKY
jgi:UDP-2,3-diacylglucosamine pyrophosphatase LpxH